MQDIGPIPKVFKKLSEKDMLIIYPNQNSTTITANTNDIAMESCSIDIRTNCMSVVSVTSVPGTLDLSRKHSLSPRKY